MTFAAHVKSLKKKLTKRLQVVKAMAGTSWGCGTRTLRKLYCQFIQPVALYGSSTYVLFSRQSTRENVDKVAVAGARIITGCPTGTRSRTVLAEADIRTVSSLAEENGATLREKVLRLPSKVSARQTATRKVKRRLKARTTWRSEAERNRP